MNFINKIILLSIANHFLFTGAMEKPLQTYYYQFVLCKRLYENNIEENYKPDIFYQKSEMIDTFNRVFKFEIPYHTPFILIQSNKDQNKPYHINRFLDKADTIWNIENNGIPLSFIKEKAFVIEENTQVSNFIPSPNQEIDFSELENIFEKNPIGIAQYHIQELISKKLIEKDGDGYKHGPDGYFAQKAAQAALALQQLKHDAHTAIENRIIGCITNNNLYSDVSFLILLQRT
jgi:hypothetical protein